MRPIRGSRDDVHAHALLPNASRRGIIREQRGERAERRGARGGCRTKRRCRGVSSSAFQLSRRRLGGFTPVQRSSRHAGRVLELEQRVAVAVPRAER